MSIQLAVIGAGPRGVGVIERLAANLPLVADGLDLVVHLIDTHPPGAGRIWRHDQSALLKLNSMARDVTMFTDESSTVDGPVWPGPSLIDWAIEVRTGLIDVRVDDKVVAHELEHLAGDSFPTRRLQSVYLDWFYRRAVAALPAVVVEHAAEASTVLNLPNGQQRVTLDSGAEIDVDLVLYALGHTESQPDAEHTALAQFALAHGLTYLAPAFTADADTSAIAADEPVIVRGMGLAAVDLTVLLTEGRGGRFVPSASLPGQLDYLPSGREPRLLLGSRRGVPYHSKISSALAAARPTPRFFSAAIAAQLEAGRGSLSFRHDVWPLIAAELLWGYYHELFVGHPDRVRVSWSDFAPFLERYRFNDSRLKAAIDSAVPNPVDRLNLDSLDRPLACVRASSRAELQNTLRHYIGLDLHARSAPEHSATLGLFTSLLYSLFDLGTIIDSPKWTARSRAVDLAVWWPNFFSFIASGPPAHRLHELLALSRAGVVEFLGANVAVTPSTAGFVASSSSVDGSVTARVLVDARLPAVSVSRSTNAALLSLVQSGDGCEERIADTDFDGSTGLLVVRASDARVLSASGEPHPRRFAVGPYTTAPFVGAFSRPGTNAVSFRENDRVARALLVLAAQLEAAGRATSPGSMRQAAVGNVSQPLDAAGVSPTGK